MHGNRETGVIVIAHGSPEPVWSRMIHEVVRHVHVPIPLVPAFLEERDHMISIATAIEKLENKGIRNLIVVPLFISGFTTHIDEIRYMLGLIEKPADSPAIPVIRHRSQIQFCSPLNDHRLVIDILLERIRELYTPESDEIVVVAHGVNDDKAFVQYDYLLQRLQQQIEEHLHAIYSTVPLHPVHYATFYPKTLKSVVEQVALRKTPVVIPFFLSEGYFTKTLIPEKLKGLQYKYTGKTLLPHENISRWIEEQIWNKVGQKNSR